MVISKSPRGAFKSGRDLPHPPQNGPPKWPPNDPPPGPPPLTPNLHRRCEKKAGIMLANSSKNNKNDPPPPWPPNLHRHFEISHRRSEKVENLINYDDNWKKQLPKADATRVLPPTPQLDPRNAHHNWKHMFWNCFPLNRPPTWPPNFSSALQKFLQFTTQICDSNNNKKRRTTTMVSVKKCSFPREIDHFSTFRMVSAFLQKRCFHRRFHFLIKKCKKSQFFDPPPLEPPTFHRHFKLFQNLPHKYAIQTTKKLGFLTPPTWPPNFSSAFPNLPHKYAENRVTFEIRNPNSYFWEANSYFCLKVTIWEGKVTIWEGKVTIWEGKVTIWEGKATIWEGEVDGKVSI